jgi:hypothetical protein
MEPIIARAGRLKRKRTVGGIKYIPSIRQKIIFFLLVISILQQSLKGNLMCTDILTYKRMVIDEGCTDIYSVWKFEIFVLL